MLVLSRKSTERIHIGDNIVVTVLGIRGNNVRLGIDAPKDIHVLRSELKEVIPDLVSNVGRPGIASVDKVLPSVI